jgi:hypothetical protein
MNRSGSGGDGGLGAQIGEGRLERPFAAAAGKGKGCDENAADGDADKHGSIKEAHGETPLTGAAPAYSLPV